MAVNSNQAHMQPQRRRIPPFESNAEQRGRSIPRHGLVVLALLAYFPPPAPAVIRVQVDHLQNILNNGANKRRHTAHLRLAEPLAGLYSILYFFRIGEGGRHSYISRPRPFPDDSGGGAQYKPERFSPIRAAAVR